MRKRIISFLLTIVIIIGIAPMGVYAADYETQLRQKGFPESYIAPLAELHKKYPKWEFEALSTGEAWEQAVNAERNPHKKQVVQMTASNDKRNFYCQCADCYKNGSYVIREGKNWVAASENAVAYYMDPRESLDERYIFQFETIDSNQDATQAGVEAILKGTWMYNANISYKDADGKDAAYSPATKYSQAIMEAAKKSGLSAYFLASKIVQEVGGANPTAGGASGTYSGYEGIYNYYNICAYTSARDGLDWAATTSTQYKTNCNAILREKPTTNSSKLVTIPNKTVVTYLGTTATQPDGYKWYSIRASVSGTTYTGYVRSDLIDGGVADKYNRPWTNPYISIINGAVWIANNFVTQNTGYFQKFNVNPASGSQMHDHEYMANVQAASQEASKTYNAYNAAGLLNTAKKFVIPVFKNLPGDTNPLKVQNIQLSEITETSVRISYNHNYSVDGYEIQVLNDKGEWEHYVNTGYSNKVWDGFESGKTYTIRVRTYMKSPNGLIFSDVWSDTASFTTKNYTVQNVQVSEITENSARISYNHNYSVDGYEIQVLNDKGEWEHYVNTGYSNKVWDGFKAGTAYTIRVRTYMKSENGLIFSPNWSETVSFTTKTEKCVTNVKVTEITENSARISYDHDYSAGGYEIQVLNSKGEWEHYVNTGYSSKVWGSFIDGTKHTIRVRTYQKTPNGLVFSNAWSDSVSFTTKPLKVQNVKVTEITPYSARISYDHIHSVDGFEIQTLNDNGEWIHYVNTGYSNKIWDGFASGKTYTIRVRTYMKSPNGLIFSPTWSDAVKFTTASDTVKNVKVSEITENSVRISYDHNYSVGGYEIQMLNSKGEWEHYVNTGYSSKVWGSFIDGTKHTIRVRTYQKTPDGLVFSNNWSDSVSFTTKPLKVQNVKVTEITSNSARISYDHIYSVDGFEIQVLNNNGEWEHYVNTGWSNKVWDGFDSGKTYTIRVRTYMKSQSGLIFSPTYSDTVEFTTK